MYYHNVFRKHLVKCLTLGNFNNEATRFVIMWQINGDHLLCLGKNLMKTEEKFVAPTKTNFKARIYYKCIFKPKFGSTYNKKLRFAGK